MSRIQLNPLRRQARHLLDEPQAMHAQVLGGLAAQPVEERVLWRLDGVGGRISGNGTPGEGDGRGPVFRQDLLVLTESRPSWEHLVEQAGWPGAESPDTPQAEVRDYRPLLERLAVGQTYAFRLTANPTESIRQPIPADAPPGTRPRSVRHGHRTVENQLRWFLEHTEDWGFEVPVARAAAEVGDDVRDVRIVSRARRSFSKGRKGKGARTVTLQVVTYEGRLTVTNPDQLRERLQSGCGPAKAYGCGLLTLAPLAAPGGAGSTGAGTG